MTIIANKIVSALFTADLKLKTIACDASDLKGRDFLSQVYNDSADVGFTLVGPRGDEATWFLSEEIREGEETKMWKFDPAPETLRAMPAMKGFTLVIFND
jgi:hypothetical protein